jgi:hypothetical protein
MVLGQVTHYLVMCAAVQSGFIPGILGRTEVLDIILDGARQDTKANYSDIMSEYTAVNLFLSELSGICSPCMGSCALQPGFA